MTTVVQMADPRAGRMVVLWAVQLALQTVARKADQRALQLVGQMAR